MKSIVILFNNIRSRSRRLHTVLDNVHLPVPPHLRVRTAIVYRTNKFYESYKLLPDVILPIPIGNQNMSLIARGHFPKSTNWSVPRVFTPILTYLRFPYPIFQLTNILDDNTPLAYKQCNIMDILVTKTFTRLEIELLPDDEYTFLQDELRITG
jgi:hypothetical protein